ncbi:MAG: hypothetical protein ABIS36_19565 [Chryseolinea sp.]
MWVALALLFSGSCQKSNSINIGKPDFISDIKFDALGSTTPEVQIDKISEELYRIEIKYKLTDSLRQDDWKVIISPAFKANFHWASHLTPESDNIIAQHVFRAPAMIMSDSQKQIVIIPDLNLVGKIPTAPWYMDLNALENKFTIGLSRSKVVEHVIFSRAAGMVIPPGEVAFGFYVMLNHDEESINDPWRKPLAFFWKKWFQPLYKDGQPVHGDLEPYVRHAYNWAFNSWKKNVWQEFEINGKKVGAPAFIVNVTQSPNYPGQVNEREFRSVWNQAWFSSLRSASGLYRYAKKKGDKMLLDKANLTKELALAFPQDKGLFPSVAATEMEEVKVDGQILARSKGWNTLFFGNSNRNPIANGGSAKDAPYHILDMSWTAYLMLIWNQELDHDERLVAYAKRYADRLLELQDTSGFFPAWLDAKTQAPLTQLSRSPETSMSVTFLMKLYEITKDSRYKAAATKSMDAVIKNIIPTGQWEDFETYWSCSRVLDSLLGKKIARNDAFKQNTLSMYWTAEALMTLYQATGDLHYLKKGRRVIDELLMYQATWQPPFIAIKALGGFGVMNSDGEWNDSRQSLFAELIARYGMVLREPEYVARGLSAVRASFVMMYCPENPETKQQWEQVYPFFNEKDYGFMMENYGHEGETNAEGLGIGEFTIYDWGNGAAAEVYSKMVDKFGKDFVTFQ